MCDRSVNLFSFERAHFNISEGDLAMVALEGDVAGIGPGKKRHAGEFAFGDALFEVIAANNVLEILYAIDFVDAFLGADDEPDVISFAGGFSGIERIGGFRLGGRRIVDLMPAEADSI